MFHHNVKLLLIDLHLMKHLTSSQDVKLLFVSMGPDYVSELRPPTGLVHPQVTYEYGELQRKIFLGKKPKNSEINLSKCHFVHHKLHTDRTESEPGPPR
jgi:hypothetical protein